MILLLGGTGYLGQAFVSELRRRQWPFRTLSRGEVDYTQFTALLNCVRDLKPAFLINAAGYTGKPNVDACEVARADTLWGNTLFPQTVAQVCVVTNTSWGHVSSGCIYSGAKVIQGNSERIEPDLTKPELRSLLAAKPHLFRGFTETDEPNFTFRCPPCSFYSGTKGLAEEAIQTTGGQAYIWRLRIPFDEQDNARNYLSKVQRYAKVYDNVNSISHRADFVRACLDLWERRAAFGIYNVTNPGFVTTRQVVELVGRLLNLQRKFEFWANDEEFYRQAAKTPRSNCILDLSKLLATGVKIRPVDEALTDSLQHWKPETK